MSLATGFRLHTDSLSKVECKHGEGNPLPVCMQAACMSATLLAACFACSLVHPQRAVDLALYTPLHLWEGVDLFLDLYRCVTQCIVLFAQYRHGHTFLAKVLGSIYHLMVTANPFLCPSCATG